MLLFQNCGIQTLDSTDSSTGPDVLGIQVVGLPVAPEPGLKQSYLAESSDAPIYKLEITDINQELLVYVPSSLLSAINFSDVDTINWKFEHAAGGEVAIDLVGRAIDLSELDVDLDLFLNGTLKAVLADGSNIALFYIVEKDETEVPDFIQSIIIDVPVVGLKPPEVVGEPIRQTMGMPVAPEVLGKPYSEK